VEPSPFATWVVRREKGVPSQVVDVGCGRAVDDLWLARQGAHVTGFDYVLRGSKPVAALARAEDVDLELRRLNLCELRSTLAESARVAQRPGPRVVTARHVADATDRVGRQHLWRACEMMLRGGGRLYLEFLVARGDGEFARQHHVHALSMGKVVEEVEARGGRILGRSRQSVGATVGGPVGEQGSGSGTGSGSKHRIARMVVEWHS
jgi:hypothetical protein